MAKKDLELSPKHSLPEPIFGGFHIKPRRIVPVEWNIPHVVEICNTTLCQSGVAYITDFVNPLTFANSIGEAEEAFLPDISFSGSDGEEFVGKPFYVYAYRVFPVLFDTSGVAQLLTEAQLFKGQTPPSEDAVNWEEYTFLGYDVVEMHSKYCDGLGCSPLSCNSRFQEYTEECNEYCLIKDKDVAYKLAVECGVEQPEPGPYVITQVWRKPYKPLHQSVMS